MGYQEKKTARMFRMIAAIAAVMILFFSCFGRGQAEDEESKAERLRRLNTKMDIKKKLIEQSQSRLHYEKFRLSVVNQREQDLSSQLKKTESSLYEVEESIRNIRDRRYRLGLELDQLRRDLKSLQSELTGKQKGMRARLREMYINRESSYFAVILESENFSDFINRLEFFQRIMKGDTELVAEIKAQRKKIEEEKAREEAVEAELASLEVEKEKKQSYFGGLKRRRGELLGAVKQERDQIADNVYEMEILTRELEQSLQSIIREAQAINENNSSKAPIRSERNFVWPVRGFITSNYGYRVHPIRGSVIFHSGIDIAAMYGAPICATASGLVIYSGWYGGYGNAVIVDHGNGYSSLYAHCSTVFVGKGQSVTQGNIIASIGSTGMSTGPHLHFEIRQNGVPVDPRSRL